MSALGKHENCGYGVHSMAVFSRTHILASWISCSTLGAPCCGTFNIQDAVSKSVHSTTSCLLYSRIRLSQLKVLFQKKSF